MNKLELVNIFETSEHIAFKNFLKNLPKKKLVIGINCLRRKVGQFQGTNGDGTLQTGLSINDVEKICKNLGMNFTKFKDNFLYCEVYT